MQIVKSFLEMYSVAYSQISENLSQNSSQRIATQILLFFPIMTISPSHECVVSSVLLILRKKVPELRKWGETERVKKSMNEKWGL